MKLKIFTFSTAVILLVISLTSQLFSMNIKVTTKDGQSIDLYGDSYALVVGVSRYTNGWSNLPNAVKDAR